MKETFDSIVIGAGQAGLAAAYYLQKRGLKYLVLEGCISALLLVFLSSDKYLL